jgi:hypothetical protein
MPVSLNNTQVVFNDATTQTTSGVTEVNVGTGISSTGGKTPTLTNTGVTSVAAGSGISVSASTGGVTISASGGVTSLNGQTGAITNTDYGVIGSYTIASENNFTPDLERSVNVTVAGSTLLRSTSSTATGNAGMNGGAGFNGVTSSENTNLGLSGTWRRLTRSKTSSFSDFSAANLYVRIS